MPEGLAAGLVSPLSDYEVGPKVADGGPEGCQDPRCTRVNGECVGFHCAACGEPSSQQGHYVKFKDGGWGMSCAPERADRKKVWEK